MIFFELNLVLAYIAGSIVNGITGGVIWYPYFNLLTVSVNVAGGAFFATCVSYQIQQDLTSKTTYGTAQIMESVLLVLSQLLLGDRISVVLV